MSSFEEQEKRIAQILAPTSEEGLRKSPDTVRTYQDYLEKNIERPCLLTGIEDFPWEERYVFGYGDEKEYEELKKTRASYRDIFELIAFEEWEEGDEAIMARVKRKRDNKKFTIGLDWLKAVDKESSNYQLLDDFAVWHVNY